MRRSLNYTQRTAREHRRLLGLTPGEIPSLEALFNLPDLMGGLAQIHDREAPGGCCLQWGTGRADIYVGRNPNGFQRVLWCSRELGHLFEGSPLTGYLESISHQSRGLDRLARYARAKEEARAFEYAIWLTGLERLPPWDQRQLMELTLRAAEPLSYWLYAA